MSSPRDSFDAIVVGAGPAGSVAARHLAMNGLRVLLLHEPHGVSPGANRDPLAHRIGESLPPAARPLLNHLGLLDLVESGGHLPSLGNCSAWGTDSLEHTDFIRDPNGLGWHLDRTKFDRDLLLAARAAGVRVIPHGVRTTKRVEPLGHWLVETQSSAYQAKWLIDATGRKALIARQQGAIRSRDADTMAVYGFVRTDAAPEGTRAADTRTLIESSRLGWWYSGLLPSGERVVSFHTDRALAGDLMLNPKSWLAALEETKFIRSLVSELPRLACAEACGARLDRFTGEGWIAVGDAALSLDPLSSQGLFNAIYTGFAAARAIVDVHAISSLGSTMRVRTEAPHSLRSGRDETTKPFVEYEARLEQIRSHYAAKMTFLYASEQRFQNESFWSLRSTPRSRSA